MDIRRRALDDISNDMENSWVKFNPLFERFIPQFDASFNRGTPLNLDYYVTRKGRIDGMTFEEEMCGIFFTPNSSASGKAFVLRGKVGTGKTCFSRYIGKQLLQRRKGEYCIYVDARRIIGTSDSEIKTNLENKFRDSAELSLTSGDMPLFRSQKDMYLYVLGCLGYQNLSDEYILENGGKKISLNDLLRYLIEHEAINKLLIIIDNIDENLRRAVAIGRDFAFQISSTLWQVLQNLNENGIKKSSCVLIPAREYTANWYFDTERFAIKDLHLVDEEKVIVMKLKQAEESIKSSTKPISEEISWVQYVGPDPALNRKKIVITKDYACKFLIRLSEIVFEKESELLSIVKTLAGSNLKIFVHHFYNLIHSNKLPLTPLFVDVFTPDYTNEKKYEKIRIPNDLACECLLAIHFPFYDVKASLIMNIFNAASDNAPNSYQNTLVIPRLMCLLRRSNVIKFEILMKKMNDYGYHESFVRKGLKKLFHYGLLTSEHGIRLKHIEKETFLGPTSAIDLYLDYLIFEPSYLQYVCEDVPMPEKLVVPIAEKYPINYSHGDKTKRFKSIEKLISFVMNEEKLEEKVVLERKQFNKDVYLYQMSLS